VDLHSFLTMFIRKYLHSQVELCTKSKRCSLCMDCTTFRDLWVGGVSL